MKTIGNNDPRNLVKIIEIKDNNEGEIIACIEALKIIEHKLVNIFIDSRLDHFNKICRTDKCKNLFNQLDAICDNLLMLSFIMLKVILI